MLLERGEQFGDRRVVSESLADVYVAIGVAGTENESRAQLERIFAQLVLAMASGVRAFAGDGIVAAQQVQKRSLPKTRGAIGFPLSIDEQRKRDARLIAENARVVHVTQSDGRQIRASRSEFRLVLAQLRDVLAAEYSPIMTKKYHDGRAILPQRAEADRALVRIRQSDFT